MKTNYIIAILVVVAIGILALTNTPQEHDITYTSQSCCEIIIERTSEDEATVRYISAIPEESFNMYVMVEYPDPDYTLEEELNMEIEYAVNQMQEFCYHHHYDNEAQDIQDRALEMPYKDCYTWQEIEIIIFGEIQE